MYLNTIINYRPLADNPDDILLQFDEGAFKVLMDMPQELEENRILPFFILSGIVRGILEMLGIQAECVPKMSGSAEIRVRFLKWLPFDLPPTDL